MIKANQCEFSLSQLDLNMSIPNDINISVRINTIPNGSNTVVGISICHDIYLYFGHGLHEKAWGLFKASQINRPGFTAIDMHNTVQP